MKILFHIKILCLFAVPSFAQDSFYIKGTITDKKTSHPIKKAKVSLYGNKDSLVNAVFSDKKGFYFLTADERGSYYILADKKNYYKKKIVDIKTDKPIDKGDITLDKFDFSQAAMASKWKYDPYFSDFPHFGYAWQGVNTFDVGLRLFTLTKGRKNFSIMGNAIIFTQNVTYVSPELKIRYYKPLKIKKRTGLAFSLSYWTSKVQSIREYRITPEIAFALNRQFNFCYGYNIPVSKNRISFISTSRLAIRYIFD